MSVAWVGVAASVGSGLLGASAAGDAADAQSASADKASAAQQAALKQQRADLMPWMQGGQTANNALLYRLGLGGGSASGAPSLAGNLVNRQEGQAPTRNEQLYQTNDKYRAAWDGLAAQHQQAYGQGYSWTSDADWIENGMRQALAGDIAAEQAAPKGAEYGSLLKEFDQSDLDRDLVYQNGLKFGLDTGVNQLNNRAAAAGGYGSGAALKALTRFGNDYATTKTAGAYDRNMQGKQQTYNFLSGTSQQGQNAAAGVGAAGISTANNIGNNIMGSGNAQAAGIVGGANAMGQGLAGATNAFQWNQLMSKPTANNYSGSSYNPSAANYENSFDRMN